MPDAGPTVGLVALDRAEAQPWTISEQGVVTRQDLHPNGPPPNPLRHVPDELLVKLRPGLTPAAASRALASVPWRSAKRFHAVEPSIISSSHRAPTCTRRCVRSVVIPTCTTPSRTSSSRRFRTAPNDQFFTSQWSLHIYAGIDAIEAWDVTTGSTDVVVAVLDTGIDYLHVDLVDNLFRNEAECTANGWDDDGNGVVDDCRTDTHHQSDGLRHGHRDVGRRRHQLRRRLLGGLPAQSRRHADATPTNGATFEGWSGACTGKSPTCTLTMSGNRSATAKFKR